MSDIKVFKVTGVAAESYKGEKKTRKRQKKEGGGLINMVANSVSNTALELPKPLPTPTPAPAPVPVPAPPPAGGAVKVILTPSTKKTKKIILSPAKKLPSPVKPKVKTHKLSRRIHVSVGGLKKRVNRAKTIKSQSKDMSIDALKKELQKASLIKEGSKAPESILRQMYADYEMIKQRAL
jgi:hypothetical protein